MDSKALVVSGGVRGLIGSEEVKLLGVGSDGVINPSWGGGGGAEEVMLDVLVGGPMSEGLVGGGGGLRE